MTPNKKRTLGKEFSSNPKLLYQNFIAEPKQTDYKLKTLINDILTIGAVVLFGLSFILMIWLKIIL